MHVQPALLQARQGLFQPLHIQLLAQHFFLGLGQQQVGRVVLAEHVEEQPAGSLQLSRALLRTGITGEHQPGDAGDLAKTPARQLAGIEAGQHVVQQVARVEQRRGQPLQPVHFGGREQFQAIVVHRDGKGQRLALAHAPGQQAGQAEVHVATGEGVEEQVPALAGFQHLGQQRGLAGQRRPVHLHLQQRLHQAHLLAVEAPPRGGAQLLHHGIGQFAGKRHAPAVPAWHGRLPAAGAVDVDGHVLHPHQLQQAPGEEEVVTRPQARDETFLDGAQRTPGAASGPEFHRQAGIADDGADAHAMAQRHAFARHFPQAAFVRLDALIIRVGRQRMAAVAHERQRPLPLVVVQLAIGPGLAHFGEEFFGAETATQRHADQMLHQHIQRSLRGAAGLDPAFGDRHLRRGGFDHFQAVGGHQRHP